MAQHPLHAMFIHAHPDDESSKGAATMARYVKEGYRVSVVTLTDGCAGDILNPKMNLPGVAERMRELRAEELARALEVLGVNESYQLGYPDSGFVEDFDGDGGKLAPNCFYNVDADEVVGRLVELMRRTRPDVLVTYPEGGGYPHPDHIRCHEVSVAAFDAAADGDWRPRKLYYVGVYTRKKVELLHEAALRHGIESPFGEWLKRKGDDEEDATTTSVEVGDFLAQRSQALLAHATQIDPDGRWFAIPDSVIREVYPYEDFTLARSLVDTAIPESSLFAGLE